MSTVAGGGTNAFGSVLMRVAVVFFGTVNVLAFFGVVKALTFLGVVTTTAVVFLGAANAVLFGVV